MTLPFALEQMAAEPELAEWFRTEQEFAAVLSGKFRDIPVETATGNRFLRELQRATPAHGSDQ